MDKFSTKTAEYIRAHHLIEKGDRVLVGLSGGADSTALLFVLHDLQRVLGFQLFAIHVNHGIRGEEAKRDEAFSIRLAESLDIPCSVKQVDVKTYRKEHGLSEEEAARILRYEALYEEAGRLAEGVRVRIALAHHADDQAETILMNLFRGSGLKGLRGMTSERDDIIRPFLSTERADILQYLEKKSISHVEDSTNACNDYTRNYLRNVIFPGLKENVNQRMATHVVKAGERIAEADAYFTAEAKRILAENSVLEEGESEDILHFQRRSLKEIPPILREYVIIEGLLLLKVPLKDWGEKHFKDIAKAFSSHSGCHIDLPGEVSLDNSYTETIIRQRRSL